MKKIYLTTIVFSLLGLFSPVNIANAQWATSGSNIYNTNSGNVGVGISNPLAKFEVFSNTAPNSRVRWSDSGSYGRFTLGQGSTEIGSLQAIGTGFSVADRRGSVDLVNWYNGGTLTFWTNSGTLSEKMRITSAGNVGIGTTTPTSKLYVQGDIGSQCTSGTATSGHISTIGWHSITYGSICTIGPKARLVVTQDNNGTGDISVISIRIGKNSITATNFKIEFYVNAVPVAGNTKFNWTAIKSP